LSKANEELRRLNNVGKRIAWCRKQLGLTISEVVKGSGIIRSSYFGRENGVRTYLHEEYMLLASFFDSKWKAKFGQSFPVYETNEIYKVKVIWIMFGVMDE
jgi:transcriptional regulator with XRE-family HTH domain